VKRGTEILVFLASSLPGKPRRKRSGWREILLPHISARGARKLSQKVRSHSKFVRLPAMAIVGIMMLHTNSALKVGAR
jgi:hypothetical protein